MYWDEKQLMSYEYVMPVAYALYLLRVCGPTRQYLGKKYILNTVIDTYVGLIVIS